MQGLTRWQSFLTHLGLPIAFQSFNPLHHSSAARLQQPQSNILQRLRLEELYLKCFIKDLSPGLHSPEHLSKLRVSLHFYRRSQHSPNLPIEFSRPVSHGLSNLNLLHPSLFWRQCWLSLRVRCSNRTSATAFIHFISSKHFHNPANFCHSARHLLNYSDTKWYRPTDEQHFYSHRDRS